MCVIMMLSKWQLWHHTIHASFLCMYTLIPKYILEMLYFNHWVCNLLTWRSVWYSIIKEEIIVVESKFIDLSFNCYRNWSVDDCMVSYNAHKHDDWYTDWYNKLVMYHSLHFAVSKAWTCIIRLMQYPVSKTSTGHFLYMLCFGMNSEVN